MLPTELRARVALRGLPKRDRGTELTALRRETDRRGPAHPYAELRKRPVNFRSRRCVDRAPVFLFPDRRQAQASELGDQRLRGPVA